VVDYSNSDQGSKYIVDWGLLHIQTFQSPSNKFQPIAMGLAAPDQVNSSNSTRSMRSHGTLILATHIPLQWVFSTDNSFHIDMSWDQMPELVDRASQLPEGMDIHIDMFPR